MDKEKTIQNLVKETTKDQENDQIKELVEKTKEVLKNSLAHTTTSVFSKSFLKNIVSKKKIRFNQDGFDLDLTYITENIIAMGFPSNSLEKFYRNGMEDVKKFFETKHSKKYKVYNLCSEKTYPDSSFNMQAHFPFDDHEAPPFPIILEFCKDLSEWLKEPDQVAAVHCKAGKGRTGTMICSYLLYSGFVDNADDALRFYGKMRTENGKGVTIPSQIRYVYYFEHLLKGSLVYPKNPPACTISKIKMYTIPKFNLLSSGCTPFFKILNQDTTYNYKENNKVVSYNDTLPFVEFYVGNLPVFGDVKIEFLNKTTMGYDKMFTMWFNTVFLPNDGILTVKKSMLDKACKDKENKYFDSNFKIEIYFIMSDKKKKNTFDLSQFDKIDLIKNEKSSTESK